MTRHRRWNGGRCPRSCGARGQLVAGLAGLLGALLGAPAQAEDARIAVGATAVQEGDGGPASLDFPIVRSGDTGAEVVVAYATADGTASAGSDYSAQSGTVTISAGATTAVVRVPVLGDRTWERDETVQLRLTGITAVNGAGMNFTTRQNLRCGTSPHAVIALDLNGDGRCDLVSVDSDDSTVSVLLNTTAPGAAAATFAPAVAFATGPAPVAVVAGDFNGDGRPDLAVISQDLSAGTAATLTVLFNATPDGAAVPVYTSVAWDLHGLPLALAAGDFDHDGLTDLAVVVSGQLQVLQNLTARGTTALALVARNLPLGPVPCALVCADLTGDGRPDLAVLGGGSPGVAGSGTVAVLANVTPAGGAPAFSAAGGASLEVGCADLAALDLTGDGLADLAVLVPGTNHALVLRNLTPAGAAGTAFAAALTVPVRSGAVAIAAADLDGDGRPELITVNQTSNTISVLRNSGVIGGDPAFAARSDYAVGAGPVAVAVGLLTGDGRADLAVANFAGTTVTVLPNVPATITTALALGTIRNDDPLPAVTLSLPQGGVLPEHGGQVAVLATLANPSSAAVTVTLGFSGAATGRYGVPGSSIVIPAGALAGSLVISAVDNSVHDGDAALAVAITAVSGGTAAGAGVTVTIVDDDPAPVTARVALSAAAAAFSENGGAVAVTATLSAAVGTEVVVQLGASGVDAARWRLAPSTLVIPAGMLVASATVTGVDDAIHQGDQTLIVAIAAVSGALAAADASTIALSETDDEPVPVVTLEADVARVAEAGGVATLTARLSTATTVPVQVALSVGGGVASERYQLSSTQLSIPAGALAASATVTALDDAVYEGDQDLTVGLAAASGATVGASATVRVTIVDDETVPVATLACAVPEFAEAGGVATLTVTLSGPASVPVRVPLVVDAGVAPGRYLIADALVTVPAGALGATTTLSGVDDALYEGDRVLHVALGAVAGAVVDPRAVPLAITLRDDESVPTVSLNLAGSPFAENGGVATISAALSGPCADDVVVTLGFGGTAAAERYAASGGQIVIPAGSLRGAITLTGRDDAVHEGDQTVAVALLSAPGVISLGGGVVATLVDDEPLPAVTLALDTTLLAEAGGMATLTATLSAPAAYPVTVVIGAQGVGVPASAAVAPDAAGPAADPATAVPGDPLADGAEPASADDWRLSAAAIVIPAGALSAGITLTAVDDQLYEGTEALALHIAAVDGAADAMVEPLVALIVDDDAPPLVALASDQAAIAEAGGVAQLTATLSAVCGRDVTVVLDAGAAQGLLAAPTIVIPAGLLSGSVLLTAQDDGLAGGDQPLAIAIASVQHALPGDPAAIAVTIVDAGLPVLALSVADAVVTVGASTTLTARLARPTVREVAVTLACAGSAAPSDYELESVTLAIPAGALEATVVLATASTADLTGDATVIITASADFAAVDADGAVLVIIEPEEPPVPVGDG